MDNRTRQLAAYATGLRYDELTPQAIHETKRRFIDTLACAVGAYDAEPAVIARGIARRSLGRPPARLLGTLEETTTEFAAFANGVALRYADYNDAYFMKSSGHPSDNLAPVLALGDAMHSDGKTAIMASVLAYEVFCNFSDVLPREQGYDYVIHGVAAAAVAAGRMMGLDESKMAQAISLAAVPNVAMEQTRLGELSMWKGCAAANAARNGIFAAMLAADGLTGPDAPLEGKWGLSRAVGAFEWAPFGGRGGPFRVAETHLKFFPAVVHSQSPITAAMQLSKGLDVTAVEKVEVDSYWVARRYVDRNSPLWHPGTRETADHSLPYIIAAALIDGTISAESFSEERLYDPRITHLMGCMDLREVSAFTDLHPVKWPCRIVITLNDGTKREAYTEYFKGHAKNPMSDAEVETKFRTLTAGRMSAAQADKALAVLWKLDEVKDMSEIVNLFQFAKAGE